MERGEKWNNENSSFVEKRSKTLLCLTQASKDSGGGRTYGDRK